MIIGQDGRGGGSQTLIQWDTWRDCVCWVWVFHARCDGDLFNDSASGRLLVGGLVVGSGRRKRAGVQP